MFKVISSKSMHKGGMVMDMPQASLWQAYNKVLSCSCLCKTEVVTVEVNNKFFEWLELDFKSLG